MDTADQTDRAQRIEGMIGVIVELARVKERHAKLTRNMVGPDGVELAAYSALFLLVANGPMRSSVLAEQIHTDPSTASRYVSTLNNLGYVERHPDPTDRRAALVAPTQSGREKAAAIRTSRNERLSPLLDQWSDAEMDEFIRLAQRALGQFDHAIGLLRGPS